jgi:superoxide reductase
MTKKLQVYKCNVCGNIVEVLHEGVGALVCCGEPMKLMQENTTDAAQEKHVPVMERADHGVMVRVGALPHPMEPQHYIEWVELISDGNAYRQFLEPGQNPQVVFPVNTGKELTVREYCNVHGLWMAKG